MKVETNGERVRELRHAKGLTQQQLADKSRTSDRTLQRIESGEGARREHVGAVAAALDVAVEDILALSDEDGSPSAVPEGKWPVKLNRMTSGSKLFATLRDQVNYLEIDIDCEPEDEEAKHLAEMFELLETIQKTGKTRQWYEPEDEYEPEDDAFKSPAEVVKAIGRLNSAIVWLEEHEIRLYCGTYVGWEFPMRINVEGPRGNVGAVVPCKFKTAKILFSSLKDDHLRSSKRRFSVSLDKAIAAAIKINLKNEVNPEDIKSAIGTVSLFPWDPPDSDLVEFETRYRDAFFVDRFGEPIGDPQEATDGEPEVPL